MAEEQALGAGSGPGAGHVPRSSLIVLSIVAVMSAVVGLYSMWSFWPEVWTGREVGRVPGRLVVRVEPDSEPRVPLPPLSRARGDTRWADPHHPLVRVVRR